MVCVTRTSVTRYVCKGEIIMSNYIHTPKTISYRDIVDGGFSLSSSQHKKFEIPNQNCKLVRDFLTRDLARKDLGMEVGSINYIEKSSHYFLRTKALQAHSYLPGKSVLKLRYRSCQVVLLK